MLSHIYKDLRDNSYSANIFVILMNNKYIALPRHIYTRAYLGVPQLYSSILIYPIQHNAHKDSLEMYS